MASSTVRGTLEAGKLADFCIVEKNPLKIELDEVRNLRVLETIKEGETGLDAQIALSWHRP